ncbi:MAG: hypothetical protein ACE5Z5_12540 [Candidatus Bathyarchaeia archaeon]
MAEEKEVFERGHVSFRERIQTRRGKLRTFMPQAVIEVYDLQTSIYGPIMLTIDLYHPEQPKQSKQPGRLHLTPAQTLQLIASLIRAYREATGGKYLMLEILNLVRQELRA